MASRVLILFAHPALQKSRVNRVLIEFVSDLQDVTLHDLYQQYPEFDIDVSHEQLLLTTHDIIVFQHPLFWYSAPALLKEWQDLVLRHGWAYGRDGIALRGKSLLSAITTGGGEEAYCKGGHNRFTMRELLVPFEQTAVLCGMTYLPPFLVHGTHLMSEETIHRQARDYRKVIVALRDGKIDLKAASGYSRINAHLDKVIKD